MKNTFYPLLLILFSMCYCSPVQKDEGRSALEPIKPVSSFILDADTGNEMDDLYAIVRCLVDDKINLIGLTSAHFNNVQLLTDSIWHIYPTEDINTVQISQDLNESILESLDKNRIPHPVGCERMVGYSWGYYEGAPIPGSPAVNFIKQKAAEHDSINKLNILTLGPVTNVASAILQDPGLAKNIRLYALTMKLTESGAWNKNSFNARNDINGLDILLSNGDLEIFVIPGNVSRTLTFRRAETLEKLSEWEHPVSEILADRWDEVSAGESWIMWDLALVEAVIHPEWATIEKMHVPPENGERLINVYTDIDEDNMRSEFWKLVEEYRESGL